MATMKRLDSTPQTRVTKRLREMEDMRYGTEQASRHAISGFQGGKALDGGDLAEVALPGSALWGPLVMQKLTRLNAGPPKNRV